MRFSRKLLTAALTFVAIIAVAIAGRPVSAATCADLPTTVGTASTSITIPANGTYRIWAHLYAPSSTTDSFSLQIANTAYCQITVGGGSGIPGDAHETPESKSFWRRHALVWGNQAIQPGTEVTDWPWGGQE